MMVYQLLYQLQTANIDRSTKHQKENNNQNTHSSEYFKYFSDIALLDPLTIHNEIMLLNSYYVKSNKR